jgi:acyl-CoA synthetase (AMP-forming)/AMP-acid ligase II
VRNEGIGSWPARRDRKTPHRVALRHAGREWTYRQLYERVCRLAHALRGMGIGRGDRVAYLGPNHPAYLETLFAAGTLGAIFVPLNTRLAAPELEYLLDDSGSRVLVAENPPDALRDKTTLVDVTGGYEELLAAAPGGPIDEPVTLSDRCVIMYTSGTTGRPKGAVLSHGNLIWNSVNVVVDADLVADEVTLLCAPLFHTAGLNMTCLPTLLKGGTVLLEPAFEPTRMLDLIERHRVTFMFGVPAMYDAMAATARWSTVDLSSLRLLTCGGAPVPAATIRTYLTRGLTFVQGYGMTEASPGVLLLAADQVDAKAGTAGVPHFFTDVRIAGPDGADLPPGEKGEVLVSGPNVMSEYWQRPEATTEALAGGWFRSGDAAVADADGFVSIVDRIKDMIISGGENVYPAEVEDALYGHPAVAECAVIGVPDERWGEVGRAVVVRRGSVTADELLAFLRDRLAGYKVPKSVRFVDELPRSATGKVLKKNLREWA